MTTAQLIGAIIFWAGLAWLIGAPALLWQGVPAEMVPGGRALLSLAKLCLPITWLTWIDQTAGQFAPSTPQFKLPARVVDGAEEDEGEFFETVYAHDSTTGEDYYRRLKLH